MISPAEGLGYVCLSGGTVTSDPKPPGFTPNMSEAVGNFLRSDMNGSEKRSQRGSCSRVCVCVCVCVCVYVCVRVSHLVDLDGPAAVRSVVVGVPARLVRVLEVDVQLRPDHVPVNTKYPSVDLSRVRVGVRLN